MKGSRSLIALVALAILAVAAFLLLRSRPPATPAAPVSNESAAAPRQDAAAPPPPPPGPVDLGSVLGLDSLADCARGPALASIVDQMVRIDPETFESQRGGPIDVPGYDRPIIPTFERTREIEGNSDIRSVTADLDLPGRWHGLAVTGIRRTFQEESDAAALEVRFAEPAERVRETLIRHGFSLPPVGELRDLEVEGLSTVIGVERIEAGAALLCAT